MIAVAAVLLHVVPAGAADLVSKADPICNSAGMSSSPNVRALSADGRFLAFESWATNLVPGQSTRGKPNVYLRDMVAGTTVLVSHKTGEPATGGSSGSAAPLVSADGGFVVFQSTANDLIYEQFDNLDTDDLFVWDRATGVTTLITQEAGSPGTAAGGSLYYVLLSDDGRYVAFANSAPNLVPGQVDTNEDLDIFLYDRVTGSTTLVSHTPASPGTAGSSYAVPLSLSADGRYLVFRSTATNLVPGGQTGTFLYDRVSGAVTHLASGAGTGPASISADGSFIAVSSTVNLMAGQTDPQSVNDVYLYNRQAGTFTLVSHASSAALASANGASDGPILSTDGRYVVYESNGSNLVPGQTAGSGGQLFLYDRITGTNVLVSHASGSPATPSNHHQIDGPVFSTDGRYLAFTSWATNLIPGQTGGGSVFGNVFLYDRTTGATTMPSHAQGYPQQAAGRASADISLSADGRWVAFGSYSSTIDPADCNSQDDVFLHDQVAGTNELVSEHDPGSPSLTAGGLLGPGSVSDDGRFAVFQSGAPNLAAGATDGNEESDIFLHDRSTGSNTLVSGSASSPGTAADGGSVEPRISGDGRWVVFLSEAANLVPGQTDSGWHNAFLYDRVTGSRVLVDHVPSSPVQAAQDTGVNNLGISASGRYVSFTSSATNLVAGQVDDSLSTDVFVFDRLTGANLLVSRAAGSTVQAARGWEPAISADGRYIAFVSSAHNLAPGPVEFPNESWHIYLHDRSTGTTSLVSRASSPAARAANNSSFLPALSADGRFVIFQSLATDLVPGQSDPNGVEDVFLYDRVLGTMALVSHVPGMPATAGNGAASAPALSPEGTYVAFESRSNNLVAGQQDSNGERDIFLYDRRSGAVTLVSHAEALPARAGQFVSMVPAVSADGTVAFQSAAQNLTSGSDDVRQLQVNTYLYDPRTGTNRLLSGASVQEPGFPFTTFTTAVISRNGRSAWFHTKEGDVVPGDYNSTQDIFVDHTPPPATDFHTTVPCRLLDTRIPGFGPALESGTLRLLAVHGACGIPPAARALAVNVTVLGGTGAGFLVLHPGGVAVAESTTISFNAGSTRSNNAIAVLTPGVERGLAVTPSVAGGGTVHLILDVSGWFE
jgi:Tol biopolymer transport system component